ncbi:MAG: hypothetical protein ABI548_08995 [Polyangiaceae bacterium]
MSVFALFSCSIASVALAGCAVPPREASWPTNAPQAEAPKTALSDDDARIIAQPVCVGARSWSMGSLGDTVLYRSRHIGRKLAVGYFIYWSEERPWGSNAVSYLVVPALAMDAVYSHFLWLFPGIKDAMYGPGDIEGAQVEYEQSADGSLHVVDGRADDGNHAPVFLSREDLLDSKGRVVLLTDVWSHQLGSHGAARFADAPGHELKCYAKAQLKPMTEQIAEAFRMGDEHHPLRGNPAWLEPATPLEGVPEEQLAAGKARAQRQ